MRAGVGKLRLVDRDFVELTNLHRQTLFDEADVAAGLPKAVAAADKLRQINSAVEVEPVVAHVGPENVESLCKGVDVILDGADNFETRFLLNDAAVALNLPWVYGGCVGAEGQTMTILPGETGCLRCLLPECPSPGSVPTCDTVGVLAPIVGVIASIQAQEAIKILSGNRAAVSRKLTVVDLWQNRLRQIDARNLRDAPIVRRASNGSLPGLPGGKAAGDGALRTQRRAVTQPGPGCLSMIGSAAGGRRPHNSNPFLLRLKVDDYELSIFPDGRTIVQRDRRPRRGADGLCEVRGKLSAGFSSAVSSRPPYERLQNL